MTESEALARMVAPGQRRPGKYREGVIQILVTSSCDKACFNCTQASHLRRPHWNMTPDQFREACRSLKGYFGVVGMFGGNPSINPHFEELCAIMREEVPFEQRGIWSNNPINRRTAEIMRATFNPKVSNLNVHLDADAYRLFKEYWPESIVVGLHEDSRHSPLWVAMKDVLRKDCPVCNGFCELDYDGEDSILCELCNGTGSVYDESRAWELISGCDINKHWSAMIGVFRGELRAWFCEIAGAQAILHQDEPDYPDTGLDPTLSYDKDGKVIRNSAEEIIHITDYPARWWTKKIEVFSDQVRKHCHECGVPLRGHGELAQADKDTHNPHVAGDPREQVSATHEAVYKPKRRGRRVELVTVEEQLGPRLERMTDYLKNSRR